jgi:hypothetical protein
MNSSDKTNLVLRALIVIFAGLAVAFVRNPWGHVPGLYPIPLVNTNFLSTATVRRSYADLERAGDDLSYFDCYLCHEKDKPPQLKFDENHKLIIRRHCDGAWPPRPQQQLLQLP